MSSIEINVRENITALARQFADVRRSSFSKASRRGFRLAGRELKKETYGKIKARMRTPAPLMRKIKSRIKQRTKTAGDFSTHETRITIPPYSPNLINFIAPKKNQSVENQRGIPVKKRRKLRFATNPNQRGGQKKKDFFVIGNNLKSGVTGPIAAGKKYKGEGKFIWKRAKAPSVSTAFIESLSPQAAYNKRPSVPSILREVGAKFHNKFVVELDREIERTLKLPPPN